MFKERQVIKDILQILYADADERGRPVLNKDKQWDGDTLPMIAECLSNHDYLPEHAIGMTPNHQIAIVWDADDIIDRAADTHPDLEVSYEEAIDIIEQMKRRHDCNLGITWDTIDYYIEELQVQKEQDDEDEKEQTRRDEKNGLYPGKEDIAN